jgi:N-acetylmuramoyl-L-alanine amidase
MTPTRITVHCSASPNGQPYPIEDIRAFHLSKGWKDVGYHAVIQPDGELQRGRGLNEAGAHVGNCEGDPWDQPGVHDNEGNIGICLIGEDRFTRQQFDTLRRFISDVSRTYDIRPWRIFCHYQFKSAQKQGKSCPNIEVNRLIAWYMGEHDEAIWPYLLKDHP